jgi:hypothetical protein
MAAVHTSTGEIAPALQIFLARSKRSALIRTSASLSPDTARASLANIL